jgi:hypothetical protein
MLLVLNSYGEALARNTPSELVNTTEQKLGPANTSNMSKLSQSLEPFPDIFHHEGLDLGRKDVRILSFWNRHIADTGVKTFWTLLTAAGGNS